MLFNSYAFIFGFLPVTVFVFFLLGRLGPDWARGWLMLASLTFYAGWSANYIWLILGSILFNFLIGETIIASRMGERRVRTAWTLRAGIVGNLALLGYYKYADFFIANVDMAFGTNWSLLHIVLPLGISFFTFTQIAYLVDASRGEVQVPEGAASFRARGLLNYALFVTYFPHLLAGPIIHHKAVMPQFRKAENFRPQVNLIAAGLALFTIGLAKKVLFADSYVTTVHDVFAAGHALPPLVAWAGALSYTLQLYFDFSGYSDMAIGLSLLFGVRLPINFNSPYKATNIIEFWRRWHISLSNFLRDYLYIPLGGNRKGPARRYLNLYLTMLLGGIWHGAGWTFVIWGGLHGVYLILNHAWRGVMPKRATAFWQSLIYGALTFVAVVVAWVFFRASDITTAFSLLSSMFGFASSSSIDAIQSVEIDKDMTWKILLGFFIVFVLPNAQQIIGMKWIDPDKADETHGDVPKIGRWLRERLTWTMSTQSGVVFGILFFVCLLKLRQVSEFIYYQF